MASVGFVTNAKRQRKRQFQYIFLIWFFFFFLLCLSLQLPQSDLEALDPNCRRFRLENGESLAEIDEVCAIYYVHHVSLLLLLCSVDLDMLPTHSLADKYDARASLSNTNITA